MRDNDCHWYPEQNTLDLPGDIIATHLIAYAHIGRKGNFLSCRAMPGLGARARARVRLGL